MTDLEEADLPELTELRQSARHAGWRKVRSGQWGAEKVLDLASRLKVRDRDTLVATYGCDGHALAWQLIRSASRSSAAVGATAGALTSATALLPPAWTSLPVQIAVETVAVVAVELKLIAELHEAYGVPIPVTGVRRATVLVRLWAERRGITALHSPLGLASSIASGDPLGHRAARAQALADYRGRLTEGPLTEAARDEVLRVVRKAVTRRMARNTVTLAPILIGAAAGAEINRRATKALGHAVASDITAYLWRDWHYRTALQQ